jgi:hypothetical protein
MNSTSDTLLNYGVTRFQNWSLQYFLSIKNIELNAGKMTNSHIGYIIFAALSSMFLIQKRHEGPILQEKPNSQFFKYIQLESYTTSFDCLVALAFRTSFQSGIGGYIKISPGAMMSSSDSFVILSIILSSLCSDLKFYMLGHVGMKKPDKIILYIIYIHTTCFKCTDPLISNF